MDETQDSPGDDDRIGGETPDAPPPWTAPEAPPPPPWTSPAGPPAGSAAGTNQGPGAPQGPPSSYGPGSSYGPPSYGPGGPAPSYSPAAPGGPSGPYGPPAATGWGSPPRRRRSPGGIVTVVLVVIAVIAGLVVGRSLPRSNTATPPLTDGGNSFGTNGGASPPTSGGGGAAGGTAGDSSTAAVAKKVDPGLVDIDTQLGYQNLAAAGTGIVLNSSGLVLTNNHVINGSTVIRVTDIGNRKEYKATVVGYDETSDVAVVQIDGASGLTDATLGDSRRATVGEKVVAIGNAGGAGGTPSAAGGSITGLGESITASDSGDGTSEKLKGLIQTNANVQPGDSGGSLVDTSGVVLGIDTAASQGFSLSGGQGTEGFAIPIDTAVALAHQIVARHGSQTVHIGPTAFLGVSFSAEPAGGLSDTVYRVINGTAAKQAGISSGDIITEFDGTSVASPGDLTKALVTHHPGDRVVVVWKTVGGGSQQADVTLTMGPNA